MPIRRRKRAAKTGRRRRKQKMSIERKFPLVIPDKMVVRLPYIDNRTINAPVGGVPGEHQYRLLSIFDPDLGGVGGQPAGHDQWSNFYQQYTVIGARVEAQMVPSSVIVPGQALYFGMTWYPGTSVITSLQRLIMDKNSMHQLVGSANAYTPRKLIKNFSMKEFYGATNSGDLNQRATTFGSNPSSANYTLQVFVGAHDQSSDLDSVAVSIKIEYLVLLTKPLNLLAS